MTSRASRRASLTVTSIWRRGGSVSHTAAGTIVSSLTESTSWPGISTSVFHGGSRAPRTARLQSCEAFAEKPPGVRRAHDAERTLRLDPPRQVGPARRNRPRAAIHEPTAQRDLAVLGAPPERLELDVAQLARRRDEPHPLGQRIDNVSSAMPTRPGPARPTVRLGDIGS